jgi:N-acetylglucosaminyl-diphospho-decaprenol L-rhamnosyltransferase
MTTAVDVTVVAVSWNTSEVLPAALQSLPAAAGPLSLQYVVVDNGSTDDSVPRLRALQHPTVELIELGQNTGFTRGANVGIDRARGRYVLLCNPDIVAPPGAIAELVAHLDARPEAWAATPWFLNADGSAQWFWRRLPGPIAFPFAYLRWGKWLDRRAGRPVWRWRSYRDLGVPPAEPIVIDAVGAAFLLVRRDDLEAAGGLDERFFNFFSDAALMRDRSCAGRTLLGCGDVEVRHDRGVTFRQRPRWHREAEFLSALALYVGGEPAHRRWPMRASLALELALPHDHRRERRQAVRTAVTAPVQPRHRR